MSQASAWTWMLREGSETDWEGDVWAEGGFSEFLSLVFNKVSWALLYLTWNTNNELLCSTGNSTQF